MARRQTGLSERHRKIMEFLTRFQDSHGYSPSIRQIGDSINVKSTSLVDYYLNQLQNLGYIEREDRISRSIRVLQPIQPGVSLPARVGEAFRGAASALASMVSIPIAGRIVASEPIPMPVSDLNYYDAESSVDIARSLLPAKDVNDLFALEVSGDSMIDAMINDGDIVVMKKASSANNGEMVAIWLDDNNETTLKYFYKEADRIRLQPANPNMEPIFVKNPKSLRIMGKVVMVIRQVHSVAG
ncbi:MAG TPA: transcriptional repressor LexA [Anaerolineaceae bacterium]|jgi:repressor LexA|nr:repressor LexA [Chloroflexota bacterium]HNS07535.1 transcriptional repressor LexA [Anaerolineaceae bacterium]HNW13635.1 transcriptional repressor LexA [Anaerolineaceae bacterium]HOE02035.1 transcriptional repressor LexA [Anaerolineaceae bacterium]HOQ69193.1 transcriptional repressor LexA [Anaerolineaceae bacterium]